MTAQELADSLRGKLIVSCQAPPGDPMRETGTLVRLAESAVAGGGAAIRANEPEVVAAIVEAVDLPVIGLWKDGDVGVYITPTVRHALAIVEAGADVVAADATDRPRPDGSTFAELVTAVHEAGALVMADVST
ncbi:N-acetylmannosamine-6-phosphate 2-epimerase, partial [Streptomyces sp. NPDC056323]